MKPELAFDIDFNDEVMIQHRVIREEEVEVLVRDMLERFGKRLRGWQVEEPDL